MGTAIAGRRVQAYGKFPEEVHAVTDKEGLTPSALHAIKLKLVALAAKMELFPASEFEMPVAQGRDHPLLVEDNDGHGLYLTISMPAKEAAPRDHGIRCVNGMCFIVARTMGRWPAEPRWSRWARWWSSRATAWRWPITTFTRPKWLAPNRRLAWHFMATR